MKHNFDKWLQNEDEKEQMKCILVQKKKKQLSNF